MHPVLLQVGGFTITAYAVLHVLAAVVAVTVLVRLGGRRGLPRRPLLLTALAAVGGAYVGARLLHLLLDRELYADDPARLWSLHLTGFALYGGLIGSGVAGLLVARRAGLPVWRTADVAAVAAGLAIAVTRVGCYLNGCCFGRETDVAWGVTFPVGSPSWVRQAADADLVALVFGGGASTVDTHAVHPTQVYELVAALGVAALAWWLGRPGHRPAVPSGAPFFAATLSFTAFRALNWTLREPPSSFDAPGWAYPALYATLAVLAAVALSTRLAHPSHRAGAGLAPEPVLDLTQ